MSVAKNRHTEFSGQTIHQTRHVHLCEASFTLPNISGTLLFLSMPFARM